MKSSFSVHGFDIRIRYDHGSLRVVLQGRRGRSLGVQHHFQHPRLAPVQLQPLPLGQALLHEFGAVFNDVLLGKLGFVLISAANDFLGEIIEETLETVGDVDGIGSEISSQSRSVWTELK